jgi:hypothetical protein
MTVMRRFKNHTICFTAFLLLIFAAGCSDPDKTGTNPTVTPPTAAAVTPPSGAAGICPNATVSVTFTHAMNPSTINATTFIVTPGVSGTIAHDSTNTIFTFTPSAPLALSTAYTATITTGAMDMFGNRLAANFAWTFNTGANPCAAPSVISEFPLNGATGVCPNAVVSATFNRAMNPSTINTATFTLTGPGTTPVAGVVAYAGSTATFTPAIALALNTLYTATITTGAEDAFGNALATNFVWKFTTGSALCAPPTVISVTPPTSSTGVCPSTVATATFSEAMNPSTINATTFTLTGPGTTPVAGVVTYAGSTATFTPSSALALNTLYTATITTGARDLFGISLASNFVWTFTTSVTACAPPTVISEAPLNLATGVCPSTVLTATFSEAMKQATINATTFTLTGPGTTPVAGGVTYAPDVATFQPTNPLALNTLYTATITTGAQALDGTPLASNFVWTFTTSAVACIPIVPLSAACSFGVLAATPVVSNSGPTVVTGDVGIWPAVSITGFPPGTITGAFHPGDAVAKTAQGDLLTAYNYAAAQPGGAILTADIGGQTLAPGVYKTTSAQPSLGITGNLTLDGGGDSTAVWIFQIVSTLTTAANNSQVILTNGANEHNVFWQVGSSATLGTTTTFAGTIMSEASTSLDTGATLNGRAMALTGAVTLLSNPVNVPPCP